MGSRCFDLDFDFIARNLAISTSNHSSNIRIEVNIHTDRLTRRFNIIVVVPKCIYNSSSSHSQRIGKPSEQRLILLAIVLSVDWYQDPLRSQTEACRRLWVGWCVIRLEESMNSWIKWKYNIENSHREASLCRFSSSKSIIHI